MITTNKVIMLPVNFTQSGNVKLWFNKYEQIGKQFKFGVIKPTGNYVGQHLYILSNDVIDVMQGLKEGDKILCDERNHISELPKYVVRTFSHYKNGWIMTKELPGQGENPDWTTKIIVSTNETLPVISDEFIKAYCEEDGIDNVTIKPVEYDYEEFCELPYSDIIERIKEEEFKYSSGDETSEQWYYANIKWITSLIGKKYIITYK